MEYQEHRIESRINWCDREVIAGFRNSFKCVYVIFGTVHEPAIPAKQEIPMLFNHGKECLPVGWFKF